MSFEEIASYLNEKFEYDGIVERASVTVTAGSNIRYLCIKRSDNADKTISVFARKKSAMVVFLDAHVEIRYKKTFENICDEIYSCVKAVITDRVVTLMKIDEQGQKLDSGAVFVPESTDHVKFTDEERALIGNKDYVFNTWSGKVTEGQKLYAVGYFFTSNDDVIRLANTEKEKISDSSFEIWRKEHGYIWAARVRPEAVRESYIVLFSFIAICMIALIPTVLVHWSFLLSMEVSIVLICIPLVIWRGRSALRHNYFAMDERGARIMNGRVGLLIPYQDIVTVKLVEYPKRKDIGLGTIKITYSEIGKVMDQKIVFYKIKNAAEVYKLLLACVDYAKRRAGGDNTAVPPWVEKRSASPEFFDDPKPENDDVFDI